MLILNNKKVMNIYKRLGARPTDVCGDDTPPCFYKDGSACDVTINWAIEKLGFNDPRIHNYAWIEGSNRTNVVPMTVSTEGVHCWLAPLPEPGKFNLQYARIRDVRFYIYDLSPENLYESLMLARDKARLLLEFLDKNFIFTKGSFIDYDERFVFDDKLSDWLCLGRPAKNLGASLCIDYGGRYWKYI